MVPGLKDELGVLIARREEAARKACAKGQEAGAAFAIGIIDQLHIGEANSDMTDRLFKGLKNTIRDGGE